MRVLLIHEHGRDTGSGGIIATWRLHRGLLAAGIDSTLGCRRKGIEDDDTIQVLPDNPRLENLLGKISWRLGLNDIHCVSTFRLPSWEPFHNADIVNIHGWHTNYFNYLALPRLSRHKPIVATLHDMWHMTGHCSQPMDCEKWKTGCGGCPYPDTFPPIGRDGTALDWKLKRRTYRKSSMTIVGVSQWICDRARESTLRGPIVQIPNAVDHQVYTPRDKDECRAELDPPRDKRILMCAASSPDNRVKGTDLLIEALQQLTPDAKQSTHLLCIGGHADAIRSRVDIPVTGLGYISEDADKVRAYSAADVFVMPSRYEAQGIVLMESMFCGTPTVAFDATGMSEVVQTTTAAGETGGILAAEQDAGDLAAKLSKMLTDETLRTKHATAARAAMLTRFTLDAHVQSYIDLYERTLSETE